MPKNDELFLFTDITGADPHEENKSAVLSEMDAAQSKDETPEVQPEDTAANDVAVESEADDSAVEQPKESEDDPDPFEAFRAPQNADQVEIVVPSFTGTADALTAAPKAKKAAKEEPAAPANTAETPTPAEEPTPQKKKPFFVRFFGGLVPHVGDQAFDVVRKCIMLVGILVFIGASTYLIDDLVLIPMHNNVLAEALQSQYTPNAEPTLSEAEQNFNYPQDIDPAFKKLYYQNSDVRAWISYHTTDDGATFEIDYPIVQSNDNDFYLFHDFNGTYNKNGTLFFDYRNDLSTKQSTNRNTIIYGHNMASGQMFAGLNKLLYGVDYARVAPTFSMNTIYNKAEYKVFAVMLVNNSSSEGIPFGYLRTDFTDNVDFASFLSEILARSLYVYGDVDIQPYDEIVTLSTCNDSDIAHFTDGRTVIVARKVRPGEDPTTDVNTISYNSDVLMPYAWYVNQKQTPHPYYIDATYAIQPLDTLMEYLSTSTNPQDGTTTSITMFTNSMSGSSVLNSSLGSTTTTTGPSTPGVTGAQSTQRYPVAISVISTPVNYYIGSSFDFGRTKTVLLYSDGKTEDLDSSYCAVTGFDSSKPGKCDVSVHYGSLSVSFSVNILEWNGTPDNSTDNPAQTTVPRDTTLAPTTTKQTDAPQTTQATTVATEAPTTEAPTTTVTQAPTTEAPTTQAPTTTTATTTTTTEAPTTTTVVETTTETTEGEPTTTGRTNSILFPTTKP